MTKTTFSFAHMKVKTKPQAYVGRMPLSERLIFRKGLCIHVRWGGVGAYKRVEINFVFPKYLGFNLDGIPRTVIESKNLLCTTLKRITYFSFLKELHLYQKWNR